MKIGNSDESSTLSPSEQIKVKIIEELFRILTGKKIKIKIPELNVENIEQLQLTYNQNPKQLRWGIDYQYDESYQEKEEISFNVKGFVETVNGKKIEFNLEFSLNRAFSSHKSLRLRMGDAAFLDPIVINFGNKSIEFSDKKYQFDLDMDGTKEEIYFVKRNSGFFSL
ncbi:MAG: hypothetical protein QMD43_05215 [Thermodesulfovibrio sp.]|nr:hypothetical protein [Thermodesulfovibrio sp.]